MFTAVATAFQQIVTEFNGAESEDRIVVITETVLKLMKMADRFHGREISLRWRGPAATVNDILVLSSERKTHVNKPATVWQ
jgi:hypothetical protein